MPNMSSEQVEDFAEHWQNPDIDVRDMSKMWDKPIGTLYRWAFELGLKRPKKAGTQQLAMAQIRAYCERVARELPSLPSDSLPDLPWAESMGRGEVMRIILLLSDLHGGRLTPTFDGTVFNERMWLIGEQVEHAVNALRHSYEIEGLDIFGLGDFVVGENVGYQISLEELEHTVLHQVFGIVVPQLGLLTNMLLGQFNRIQVTGVRGNHGSMGRIASNSANWDNVCYLAWQAQMATNERIQFNLPTEQWYAYAKVLDLMWFLIHGDQIPGGNVYSGINTKVTKWRGSMPHFDYMAMGHFHHTGMVNGVYMNGTLLTDDQWCLEVIGKDGECAQLLIGVTKRGVKMIMPLWLSDQGPRA